MLFNFSHTPEKYDELKEYVQRYLEYGKKPKEETEKSFRRF